MLISVIAPPKIDLQSCADAVLPREDLSGVERERAFQSDIARYCSMPGTDDCWLDLVGRVNVDYFTAAGRLASELWSPAQYLALVRDRTRKIRQAEDDPMRAAQLCAGADDDEDWIPDSVDQCPNTPQLTPTDELGCTNPTLPPAPAASDVKKALESFGFLFNPECRDALVMPKIPAGAFYRPAELDKGTYILSGAVKNQPPGCPVWYQFHVRERVGSTLVRAYMVAFFQNEALTALVGTASPVPTGFIQFNPKPGDPGTRGFLGSVDGAADVHFRVRAINGNGVRSGWSEWKSTTNADCVALGFQCVP